jgi:hypothetical protein
MQRDGIGKMPKRSRVRSPHTQPSMLLHSLPLPSMNKFTPGVLFAAIYSTSMFDNNA